MDQDLLTFLEILSAFVGHKDSASDLEIQRRIKEQPLDTLLICSSIIQLDNLPISTEISIETIWHVTVIIMDRCVLILQSNPSFYYSNLSPEQRNLLRLIPFSVFDRVKSNSEGLVNTTAKLYADLFTLEKNDMRFTIERLYAYFNSDSMFTKYISVSSVAELCCKKSLGQFINMSKDVRDIFLELFLLLKDAFFTNNNQIIMKSATAITRIIELDPSIVLESISNIVSRSRIIFQNCNHEGAYGSTLMLLSTISTKYYFDGNYESIIQDVVNNAVLIGFSIPNPTIADFTIEFFLRLAKFEYKKIYMKKRYNERYSKICMEKSLNFDIETFKPEEGPICHDAINHYSEELYNRMFEILMKINIDDKGTEDSSELCPHMYAQILLKKMFKINPENTFQHVIVFWKASINSTDWRVYHAALLALSSILIKPTSPKLIEFLEVVKDVLFSMAESPILRVVDTTLYVFSLIQKNYPTLLIPYTHQLFTIIFNKAKVENQDPIILVRSVKVLDSYFQVQNIESASYKEVLITGFDALYAFLKAVIAYKYANSTAAAYKTLCFLILSTPNDFLEPKVFPILNEIVESIQRSVQSIDENPNLSNFFMVVGAIYKRINTQFYPNTPPTSINKIAPTLITLFFNIMKRRDKNLHEDCLTAIQMVIPTITDSDVFMKLFPSATTYLSKEAMISGSPTIIVKATLVMAKLIRHNNQLVAGENNGNLQEFFKLVTNCLQQPIFTVDTVTSLLYALAEVIYAAKDTIKKMPDNEKRACRDSLLGVFKKYQKPPLDFENVNDVKMAIDLYQVLLHGFRAVMETGEGDQSFINLQSNRLFFMGIIKDEIAKLPELRKDLVDQLISYIHSFSVVFGRKGNLILNRACNFYVLARAFASEKCNTEQSKKQEKKIESIIDYMKKQ